MRLSIMTYPNYAKLSAGSGMCQRHLLRYRNEDIVLKALGSAWDSDTNAEFSTTGDIYYFNRWKIYHG